MALLAGWSQSLDPLPLGFAPPLVGQAFDDPIANFGKGQDAAWQDFVAADNVQADRRFEYGAGFAITQRERLRFEFGIELLALDDAELAAFHRGRALRMACCRCGEFFGIFQG